MTTPAQPDHDRPVVPFVERRGSGPTLLLLHGVTRRGADWGPLLPALQSSWQVITLDQRGHGQSPRADRYLVRDYVTDVVRFVHNEATAPLAIIGHSLGAMVAAAVAAELPAKVSHLVLEDPPFHTMGNQIAGSVWQHQFLGMREAARWGGTIAALADRLAEIQLPARDGSTFRLGDVRNRESLEWSASCLQDLDPEVLTPVIDGRWLDGYDTAGIWPRIACPVLLLQADPAAGGALTDRDAEMIADRCVDCERVRFAGAGHQLHRDQTAPLLDKLLAFLQPSVASKRLP